MGKVGGDPPKWRALYKKYHKVGEDLIKFVKGNL